MARVSRRQFLRVTAGGAAGALALGRAPAVAQTRELTFLSIASFVPETDKELKRQFEEWGAKNKVKVRLDIIAHLQLQTTKAAEVPARSRHGGGRRWELRRLLRGEGRHVSRDRISRDAAGDGARQTSLRRGHGRGGGGVGRRQQPPLAERRPVHSDPQPDPPPRVGQDGQGP